MNAPVIEAQLDWRLIGTIDDIPLQGSRCVKNGETTIAIFRHGQRRDLCP